MAADLASIHSMQAALKFWEGRWELPVLLFHLHGCDLS